MKKILSAMIILTAIFLPSCKSTSMQDLLTYESKSYTAEFSVKYGDESIPVSLIKDGSAYTFVVDGKYTFLYSKEKWSISYDGLTVSLSSNAARRSVPSKLHAALSLDANDGWRINEDTAGGTPLYICECESKSVTLYIDATTSLPLKMIFGDIECDVVKFEISESK